MSREKLQKKSIKLKNLKKMIGFLSLVLFLIFPTIVGTPTQVGAATPLSSSSLLSAYDAYVNEQVPVNKTDVITGYSDYISEPLKLPPVSQTPITISTVSESSLLPALRTLLARQEFISLLRGPKGEQGVQGPQGLPAPSSLNNVQGPIGYNFGTTAPSAPQNNTIGTLGGFTALGAQDLTSTTIQVTGTSTLNNATISGNASIATLAVTGTSTVAGGIVFNGATDFDIDDNSATALSISEGSNNYLLVNTTNSSENISLGNAVTNPTLSILGTGLITIAGAGSETNSLTLTTGNVTLTDGDLTISSGEIAATSDDATGTAFSFTGVNTTGTTLGLTANALTSGTALDISSTSTAAASNTQKLLNISLSGANATASQTTYGGYISNTHTGTTSTNVGLYATATGATNNYAAVFENGNVGIGDTSPSQLLDIDGTNPQLVLEESTTEFLRLGIGETSTQSIIGWDDGDDLIFGDYSSPTDTTISAIMTIRSIDNGGNVGIGDTTPDFLLDVAGTLGVDGILY